MRSLPAWLTKSVLLPAAMGLGLAGAAQAAPGAPVAAQGGVVLVDGWHGRGGWVPPPRHWDKPRGWDRGGGWGGGWGGPPRGGWYQPPPRVWHPPPQVYYPPPRFYAPPPRFYAPPPGVGLYFRF